MSDTTDDNRDLIKCLSLYFKQHTQHEEGRQESFVIPSIPFLFLLMLHVFLMSFTCYIFLRLRMKSRGQTLSNNNLVLQEYQEEEDTHAVIKTQVSSGTSKTDEEQAVERRGGGMKSITQRHNNRRKGCDHHVSFFSSQLLKTFFRHDVHY